MAIFSLGKWFGRGQAVESLVAALRDRDAPVHRTAVKALGKSRTRQAIESLVKRKRLARGAAPYTTIKAPGKIADHRMIELYVIMLREPEAVVQRATVRGPRDIGRMEAREVLAAVRQEREREAALRLAQAIYDLGNQKRPERARPSQSLVSRLQELDRKALHSAATEALGLSDDVQWWKLIDLIDETRLIALDIETTNRLFPSSSRNSDPYKDVRSEAARLLGVIGDARAILPLVAALHHDEYWFVRSNAATALGDIGDAQATAPLVAALQDQHWNVRFNAIKALGKSGDEQAVKPLIAIFQNGANGETLRHAGAEALYELAL